MKLTQTLIENIKSFDLATTLQPLCYSEALAFSLILYARQNQDFFGQLKVLLDDLPDVSVKTISKNLTDAQILLPTDNQSALARAVWLIDRLQDGDLPGSNQAIEILKSAAAIKPDQGPSLLVVGIVGLAIPGITLGLIKRKHQAMSVIVNRQFATKKNYELSQVVAQAGFNFFAKSLDVVNGDIKKLEPEVALWFYEDQQVNFYHTTDNHLSQIKNSLDLAGAMYEAVSEDNQLGLLALSPSANESQLSAKWNLQALA